MVETSYERTIKELAKFAIENGNRKYNDAEKELLKKAIDESRNIDEFMAILTAAILVVDHK